MVMRTINLGKQLEGQNDLKQLLQTRGARIKDIGQGYTVHVEYDMNKESIDNAVFKLVITGRDLKNPLELFMYKEEMLHILRAV